MKKLFLLFVTMAVIFTACKKEIPDAPVQDTVELEFVIDHTDFGGLKGTNEDVPECDDALSLDYAKFIFNGTTYTSQILLVDGELLTQVVKLPYVAGATYTLSQFLIYHDVLPVGPGSEDVLVRAAPEEGSKYHPLMVNKLNLEVEVLEFKKRQVIIDVLCFEDLYYESFGFTWFEMNDVRIERQCFFGDVCTGKLGDFANSLYELQSAGVQMDMPAIDSIAVFKKNSGGTYDFIKGFSSVGWLGEGDCLEVWWANDLDLEEEFSFALYVLLPNGSNMAYTLIDSIPFLDDNCPDPGPDGVVDFTVGACNIDGADLVYPAWMNLPSTPVTMTVGGSYGPGAYGTYFDITLSAVPTNFDVSDGTYGIWCGDKNATIYLNNTYTVQVLSSLAPMPGDFTITKEQLAKINWLFNNLASYFPQINLFDMQAYTSGHPGDWDDIQHAIWALKGEIAAPTTPSTFKTMFDDADGLPWENYQVLPGQWAAVLFWDNPQVQVLFVMVDP